MNKRKVILTSIICIALFLIGVAIFTKKSPANREVLETLADNKEQANVNNPNHKEVVTTALLDNPIPNIQDPCLEYRSEKSPYQNVEELRLKMKTSPRFENTHYKYGGKIYRLRHFFKDGDEGEKEKFIVLVEIEDEDAQIKEISEYKPGTLYQKIQSSKSEQIFQEEGVQTEEGLFLHYSEGKLQSVQGTIKGKIIDCAMNP